MAEPHSITDIARATLYRLAELGLPPTPENYDRYYRDAAGAEQLATPATIAPDLLLLARSILESVTDKTAGLLSDLSLGNQALRQSVADLALAEEKHEILQLLGALVARANSIHAVVEDTHGDLTESRQALDEIKAGLSETRQLLHEDALTGAQNRRSMDATLVREVARSKRSGAPLAVAMIDLDHFKNVNDRYGHDTGDKILLHLTTLARAVLRDSDVLVRYGGEEFLLILPGADVKGAQFVLDRLRHMVQKSPFKHKKQDIRVTFSGGIAQLKPDENGHALILRADAALYEAKHAGRDCCKIAP